MSNEDLSNIQQLHQQANEGSAMSAENKPPEDYMEQFSQDKDADLSNIEVGGKHFLIKAPDRQRDSGLILSEKQQKELQNVQETPGFQDDVRVIKKSEKCEFVEEGDMILLSPHVQTLEIELLADCGCEDDDGEKEKVLYLMIHEDYVLMKKGD